jgi:aspartyl-tRNA(Asn)/glutamyl-tRNA(Gln) amidotransferase subunit B
MSSETSAAGAASVTSSTSYGGYEAVIGLEVHVQLQTATKIFCANSTAFGGHDNEHICPVCTAMPGSLPVINKKAIEFSVMTGLALNCAIRKHSVFARKQYFYPDLPKGYQISQYDLPLCEHGHVEFMLEGARRRVSIVRAHMEEDAGKSTHHGDYSLINLNRAGIPLLEIVSGPDMKSPAEAAEYARTIRKIVRYLDVCDGNLEEGSLRCDCNVSVRKVGESKLGTKVEIKNINSFRFIEKAIEYEIHRQIDCLETGEKIMQETRLYDPDKNRTFTMRTKEEAHDYRYFPDPDLLQLDLDDAWLNTVKGHLPELPLARSERFISQYKLPEYDAFVLTQERALADYFERAAAVSGNAKAVSNWVMTDLMRELNDSKKDVTESPITAEHLGQMITLIDKGTISGKIAKSVFPEMWATGKDPETIVREKGLTQITDTSAIEKIVDDVLAAHPKEVAEFRGGKEKLLGFFVGQIMRASKGQASPEVVNGLLQKKLKQ